MVETTIICFIFGIFILRAYTLGLKNGQKVSKQQPIELPNMNPVEIIQKKKIQKEQQEEMNRISNIIDNFENYDGTGANQKEV